jgi:hypothetical protein
MTKRRWILITLVATVLIIVSLVFAFASSSISDAAGWVQVLLAAFGLPILYYELRRIREAIDLKPVISIGVASVNDLPLSKIRDAARLSNTVVVNRGYPHFWLVIRNSGPVAAKSVKIHLEYKPPKRASLLLPVIEVDEWLGDKRFSFKKVNNADFVFIGGQDWVLHSHDSDMFGFYMTTAVVKQTEPQEIRERPEPGDYEFPCTVWADGLQGPVAEHLKVIIQEKAEERNRAG